MSEMIVSENTSTGTVANTLTGDAESLKLVFNATTNSDSLNDHLGEPITLKGAFLNRGVRRSYGGGEDVECVNTYIVDERGNSYFSQSAGVARDMANLITLYGGDIEGLTIMIGEREIGGGRSMKFVELV